MKVVAYKAIRATPAAIGEKVQEALDLGWQPFGSPLLDADRGDRHANVTVIQVMVRYEEAGTTYIKMKP